MSYGNFQNDEIDGILADDHRIGNVNHSRLQSFADRIVILTDTWKPGVYVVKVRSGDRVAGVKRVVKI